MLITGISSWVIASYMRYRTDELPRQVVQSGKITRKDRSRAWNELQMAAKEGKTRPFYRAVNKHGLMYAGNTLSSNINFLLPLHKFANTHVKLSK